MAKLDEFKAAGQIGASFGAGGATPAGMDLGRATTMPARLQGIVKDKDAARIPVDKIARDDNQPREEFDEDALERLAESLRTRGQLQPIRVRWDEGRGVYVVIAGERRWRAAGRAGLPMLQCIIQETPASGAELLAIQLIENALREDLKPVEQAKAYRRLMDANDWSGGRVAKELAIDPSVVTRALTLLDLPATVQAQVDSGELAARSASEIARIEDAPTQAVVAAAVVEQKLSRSEVADLVQAVRAKRPTPAAKPAPVDVDLGDGILVRITYRKASTVSPVQVLKRATKALQDRERAGENHVEQGGADQVQAA